MTSMILPIEGLQRLPSPSGSKLSAPPQRTLSADNRTAGRLIHDQVEQGLAVSTIWHGACSIELMPKVPPSCHKRCSRSMSSSPSSSSSSSASRASSMQRRQPMDRISWPSSSSSMKVISGPPHSGQDGQRGQISFGRSHPRQPKHCLHPSGHALYHTSQASSSSEQRARSAASSSTLHTAAVARSYCVMVAAQRGQVSRRRLDAALSVTGSDRIHRRGAQPGIAGIAQLPAWAEAHRGVLRASRAILSGRIRGTSALR